MKGIIPWGIGAAAVVVWASVAAGQAASYHGWRVVEVEARNAAELDAIVSLGGDIWTHGHGIGRFEVLFSPEQYARLAAMGVPHRTMIENVQALVDQERARLGAGGPAAGAGDEWYQDFKDYEAVIARIVELGATYPELAQVETFGLSLEGRELVAIRITGPGDPTDRPGLLFTGTQHAREWISPMTVTYIAERLLEDYGQDEAVTTLVDSAVVHIIPIVNPDGYAFTWAPDGNRFWRKTRSDYGLECIGVDPNRNWDFAWGGEGSSGDSCSETYRGPEPFSEVETQAVSAYIVSHPELAAHIDFHSYGQLVLSPWGYTSTLPEEQPTFDVLNSLMAGAILETHDEVYVAGPVYTTLYPASGVMPDWTFGAEDILAWTIELRPETAGQGGFVLPPDQIIPTCEEAFSAVMALGGVVTSPLTVSLGEALPPFARADEPTTLAAVVLEGTSTLTSLQLRYRFGTDAGYQAAPMVPEEGVTFVGELPPGEAGQVAEFYIEAVAASGDTVTDPPAGPDAPYALSVWDVHVAFADAMESDTGWTVGSPDDTATTGIWERADPEGTAAQPAEDHSVDGTMCWITGAAAGSSTGANDVDGGSTTLTSPRFDASVPELFIHEDTLLTYARWYSNNQGANPNQDSLPVLISNDDGQTWTELELVTENAGTWVVRTFSIAGIIEPTDQMRLRLIARDEEPGSIVEAGLDDVEVGVIGIQCPGADYNEDGAINIFDFLAFQAGFLAQEPCADVNQDGVYNIFDFLAFQGLFGGG